MEGFLKFTYEIKLKYHGVAPPPSFWGGVEQNEWKLRME